MKKIAVVYASRYGHTKLLAEHIAAGAASVADTDVEILTVEEAEKAMEKLDAADAIILGSATYMGSIASEMKHFMEAAVGRWFNRTWCNKIAGGFTNSSNFSGDKLMTMQELVVFAMQMGMIWCGVADLAGANEPDTSQNVEGPTSRAINRNSASLGVMASSFQVKAPMHRLPVIWKPPLAMASASRKSPIVSRRHEERVAGTCRYVLSQNRE